MKIGITQIILGNATLDETLALCKEAGYEAVELTFTENKDLNINMSDDELLDVRQKCADAGVEIGSIIATYSDQGNLLSRNKEERDKRCKSLARCLEIAGVLGVDGTLLHPGQLGPEGTYEEAWEDLKAALKAMAPVAEANKCAICVENVWNKFILSPREATQFVDEVGSPWVGFYLDTANMMAYGYPEQWVRSLGKRLKKVHFKDFKRGPHQFVNLLDGDTDWPILMKEIRAAGYDSALIHEVGGDHDALLDLADRMRRIIAM
ncbi:MAG: sugar phosphate isomerase/epimerase [Armatimonadetes bacterium]|nr:sugar phosphate isomerase/epimerase [Armatimonadota bacterium]